MEAVAIIERLWAEGAAVDDRAAIDAARAGDHPTRVADELAIWAGWLAADFLEGRAPRPFPRETAIGSLLHYISHADPKHYQPANIAFDLFPPIENPSRDRRERQIAVCERAAAHFIEYVAAE